MGDESTVYSNSEQEQEKHVGDGDNRNNLTMDKEENISNPGHIVNTGQHTSGGGLATCYNEGEGETPRQELVIGTISHLPHLSEDGDDSDDDDDDDSDVIDDDDDDVIDEDDEERDTVSEMTPRRSSTTEIASPRVGSPLISTRGRSGVGEVNDGLSERGTLSPIAETEHFLLDDLDTSHFQNEADAGDDSDSVGQGDSEVTGEQLGIKRVRFVEETPEPREVSSDARGKERGGNDVTPTGTPPLATEPATHDNVITVEPDESTSTPPVEHVAYVSEASRHTQTSFSSPTMYTGDGPHPDPGDPGDPSPTPASPLSPSPPTPHTDLDPPSHTPTLAHSGSETGTLPVPIDVTSGDGAELPSPKADVENAAFPVSINVSSGALWDTGESCITDGVWVTSQRRSLTRDSQRPSLISPPNSYFAAMVTGQGYGAGSRDRGDSMGLTEGYTAGSEVGDGARAVREREGRSEPDIPEGRSSGEERSGNTTQQVIIVSSISCLYYYSYQTIHSFK